MRILVVEDDNLVRTILRDFLTEWGHEVVLAKEGAEAWRLHQEKPFAIILSDWVMPEMDGLELCRRIRTLPIEGYPYFILLTAKNERKDFLISMSAGVDDFLSKPVDPEILKARLLVGQRIIRLESETKASKKLLEEELRKAAAVQQSLLPPSPLDIAGVTMFSFLKPSSYIGGDMYNVFALDERNLGIYFLDVMGHGVQAAFLAVTIHHMLQPRTLDGSLLTKRQENGEILVLSPDQVARKLNRRFYADGNFNFFTLFYGVYNLDSSTLSYIRAGAPYPIHRTQDGKWTELTSGDLPIGIFADASYRSQVVRLSPGDQLILMSDGLSEWLESEESEGTKLSEEVFKVNRPQNILHYLESRLAAQKTAPHDDLSMFILQSPS